jgi:hypothetical protein
MRKFPWLSLWLSICLCVCLPFASPAQVAINDNNSAPAASAMLDVNVFGVNKKGVLVPRMTSAERNAIPAPANSLLVFDNTTNSFWFFLTGTGWIELVGSSNNLWAKNGNDIFNTNTANVGVGTGTTIKANFHVGPGRTVIFGNDSLSSSLGEKFVYFGTKGAVRFARIGLGGGSSWDYANIGVNSLAIGEGAMASGPQSFSQGYYSNATGFYSFARGYAASANGDHSMAFGQNIGTTGNRGMMFGESSWSTGDFTFSSGYTNFLTGAFGSAFGQGLHARPYNSFVIGRFNDSIGTSSTNAWVAGQPLFLIGNGANNNNRSNAVVVLKDGRTGIGNIIPHAGLHVSANKTVIFGPDSLSSTLGEKFIWFGTKGAVRFASMELGGGSSWDYANIGVNSLAIGEGALASGPQSFSQGYFSRATSHYAFARGFAASANGNHGMTVGQNITGNGDFSLAFGETTTVNGDWSMSLGINNELSGNLAASFGQGLSARPFNSFVIGRYNDSSILSNTTSWVATDPLFIIGNGTNDNARANAVTVLKNGFTGIGTTTPDNLLHVGFTVGARMSIGSIETIEDFGANAIGTNSSLLPVTDGNRNLGSGANRWLTVFAVNGVINTSDARDKKNVSKLRYGLDALMKLNPVSFEWINGQGAEGPKLGLIAQEVLNVIPEVVKTSESVIADEKAGTASKVAMNRYGIFYSDLVPVLIKSIQEQQAIIDTQKSKIEDLEKRLQAIEAKLK